MERSTETTTKERRNNIVLTTEDIERRIIAEMKALGITADSSAKSGVLWPTWLKHRLK